VISLKKWIGGFAFSLLIVWAAAAQGAPPIPARIGGTVTVDGVQLNQSTDEGYTFVVKKIDGTGYAPESKGLNGLNGSNWYVINIPISVGAEKKRGAKPGDTAVIHVYKDGVELKVLLPDKGRFIVGESGSRTRVDVVVESAKKVAP